MLKRDGILFLFFKGGVRVVVAAGDNVAGVPVGAVIVAVATGAVPTIIVGVFKVRERPRVGVKVTVFLRTRLLRFA